MLYFITDCLSASLKRIAFSCTGAEFLAASNAADRGLALTTIVRQFVFLNLVFRMPPVLLERSASDLSSRCLLLGAAQAERTIGKQKTRE
jgi:hypothetical protein